LEVASRLRPDLPPEVPSSRGLGRRRASAGPGPGPRHGMGVRQGVGGGGPIRPGRGQGPCTHGILSLSGGGGSLVNLLPSYIQLRPKNPIRSIHSSAPPPCAQPCNLVVVVISPCPGQAAGKPLAPRTPKACMRRRSRMASKRSCLIIDRLLKAGRQRRRQCTRLWHMTQNPGGGR